MPAGRPTKEQEQENRERLLEALGRGLSMAQAAQAAGVAPSTVTRYLRDEQFKADLYALNMDAQDDLARVLVARALRAVDVLTRLMAEGRLETTRVRAASVLLAEARAQRDATLERQIAELEAQAAAVSRPTLRSV